MTRWKAYRRVQAPQLDPARLALSEGPVLGDTYLAVQGKKHTADAAPVTSAALVDCLAAVAAKAAAGFYRLETALARSSLAETAFESQQFMIIE